MSKSASIRALLIAFGVGSVLFSIAVPGPSATALGIVGLVLTVFAWRYAYWSFVGILAVCTIVVAEEAVRLATTGWTGHLPLRLALHVAFLLALLSSQRSFRALAVQRGGDRRV